MPGDGTCDPACVKIIIDTGGRIAAAADMFAALAPKDKQRAYARYLASITRADAKALVTGIKSGAVDAAGKEKAHAWSELNCHRAAAIEAWCESGAFHENYSTLLAWATQDRLVTTAIVGGEYQGRYELVGEIEDIRLKAEHEPPKMPRAEPSTE